jgi:hypothetical protein
MNNLNSKSKTAAVLIAIFLGYWSWLYTYKKDYKKFWVYLILIWAGVISIWILVYSNGLSAVLINYGTWIWLYFLINASSYIWVLINSISRPLIFYENYPPGKNENNKNNNR